MKIAFLHTLSANEHRFEQIVRSLMPTIDAAHFVDEELLRTALRDQQADATAFAGLVDDIRSQKYDHIICTCSTYGELCDTSDQVYCIDRPIAEEIVRTYTKIGLAFTAASTRDISRRLLEDIAAEQQKKIVLEELDCQHCWPHFVAGDQTAYVTEVAKTIEQTAGDCEVVFLAQASMEGAKALLEAMPFAVASSPDFGVAALLKQIAKEG